MRDSTEARRCDECGTEYYVGHDEYCGDCVLMCDEGARYEAFADALRREAAARNIPLVPCGCNADWIGETYHLSGGAPNQTPGDYYITDNEDDSWSVVRRFYIDYENAPAQDGATYAGDGHNDEVRDVLTIELLGRANDLSGAASALLFAFLAVPPHARLPVGTRVRLTDDHIIGIDMFAPKGATGTVCHHDDVWYGVLLDSEFDCGSDDNIVDFYAEWGDSGWTHPPVEALPTTTTTGD